MYMFDSKATASFRDTPFSACAMLIRRTMVFDGAPLTAVVVVTTSDEKNRLLFSFDLDTHDAPRSVTNPQHHIFFFHHHHVGKRSESTRILCVVAVLLPRKTLA